MANSFNKRELEKKKEQKKKEKQLRKEERKAGGSKSFGDMIAYVDENGVITSTPPDQSKKLEVDLEHILISTPKRKEVEVKLLNGKVEYFNPDKGFGFIKEKGGTDKYFFHISNAPAGISEGNVVTFELERGERGMNATRIAINK